MELIRDCEGTIRFRGNKVIRFLLNSTTVDLNMIWRHHGDGLFTLREMQEFYQAIGYSYDGYLDVFGDRIKKPLDTAEE